MNDYARTRRYRDRSRMFGVIFFVFFFRNNAFRCSQFHSSAISVWRTAWRTRCVSVHRCVRTCHVCRQCVTGVVRLTRTRVRVSCNGIMRVPHERCGGARPTLGFALVHVRPHCAPALTIRLSDFVWRLTSVTKSVNASFN